MQINERISQFLIIYIVNNVLKLNKKLLTRYGYYLTVSISFVVNKEIHPNVVNHYPRNRLCQIDLVWRPYFQFVEFCNLNKMLTNLLEIDQFTSAHSKICSVVRF